VLSPVEGSADLESASSSYMAVKGGVGGRVLAFDGPLA
jgi:hypothetical protein